MARIAKRVTVFADHLQAQLDNKPNNDFILVIDASSVAIGLAYIQHGKIVDSRQIDIKGKSLGYRLRELHIQAVNMMARPMSAVVIEEPFSGNKRGKTSSATIRACCAAWGAVVSAKPFEKAELFTVHPSSWQAVLLGPQFMRSKCRKSDSHSMFILRHPEYRVLQTSGVKCEDRMDALCIAEALLRNPSIPNKV